MGKNQGRRRKCFEKLLDRKPFEKRLERKPFEKRFYRKLFQKKFDQKLMLYRKQCNGVINRRNASLLQKGLSENFFKKILDRKPFQKRLE
ncbi:hypothetical protein EQO05_06785 [Methanosarcina sp. MSH10X1]|uniref:hypothetical protein n=1 Tax=Methanosarcina sp. MSH10X1 TaxID=2507075 RepID=UPI000FFC3CB4|nr:hypothetical protein [Methanosarcina sp. MSH10X1]RXA19859.1 hypothetical protein EQO05_06785 [Methanosarcina sp. MSH10X1]